MPVAGDPYRELERIRGQREANKENSARTAFAWGFGLTKGAGETRFARRINFQLAFIEQPAVAYGFSVEGVINNSDLGDMLVDTRFPRCTGGVFEWHLDSRGFYLGAWAFAVVETQGPLALSSAPEPGYSIRHSYGFTGLAFKALPERLGQEL